MSFNTARTPEIERLVHVVQGEYYVTREPGIVLTTILGSCVATCIWDAAAGVGGMNHFLLPGDDATHGSEVRYGVNAMELLINGLLQQGAARGRLQAKLFGGAQVVAGLGDIGAKNATFAEKFLATEGIPCVSQSLRGDRARRVRFWPTTGRAGQMLLDSMNLEVMATEQRRSPPSTSAAGSVELF